MTQKRSPARASSLTSLLDVLFILVFASLVQSAARVEGAALAALEPDPDEEPAPEVAEALPEPADEADAGAEPSALGHGPLDHAELQDRAIAALTRSLRQREVVFVHISEDGTVTAVELSGEDGDRRLELEVPLLARVPDPDVSLQYLGESSPELRVCSVVRRALERDDLDGVLVIMVPEVPLERLTVALVEGLSRDQARCARDQQGLGVVIEPWRRP